jgi:hypothetical protein
VVSIPPGQRVVAVELREGISDSIAPIAPFIGGRLTGQRLTSGLIDLSLGVLSLVASLRTPTSPGT